MSETVFTLKWEYKFSDDHPVVPLPPATLQPLSVLTFYSTMRGKSILMEGFKNYSLWITDVSVVLSPDGQPTEATIILN